MDKMENDKRQAATPDIDTLDAALASLGAQLKGIDFSDSTEVELLAIAKPTFELLHTAKGSFSFHHLTGNLLGCLKANLMEGGFDELPADDMRDLVDHCIGQCRRYFGLLRDFPEFREAELIPDGPGFFPEITKRMGGSKELIDAYERALRGDSSSSVELSGESFAKKRET